MVRLLWRLPLFGGFKRSLPLSPRATLVRVFPEEPVQPQGRDSFDAYDASQNETWKRGKPKII